MSNLLRLFADVKPPTEKNSDSTEIFSGVPIPYASQHHLGCDLQRRPAILLKVSEDFPNAPVISLENLRVEHKINCRIVRPSGNAVSGIFSLIRCTSDNDSLKTYFLQVMDALLSSLPAYPTSNDISQMIDHLAQLFIALKQPSSKTTQGLWAEMFLIAEAKKPTEMLNAWHQAPEERFDFSNGTQRIEVKCSSNRIRLHHFSFEQAYPPKDASVLVASLFVERASGGKSLLELWNRLRDYASGNIELVVKIEKICMDILGDSWNYADEQRYDDNIAKESLRFYSIDSIPRVSEGQPIGVSEICFKSNLELAQPINPVKYAENGLLFEAFFGAT